jgi:hypothetical protein
MKKTNAPLLGVQRALQVQDVTMLRLRQVILILGDARDILSDCHLITHKRHHLRPRVGQILHPS